MEFDIDEAVNGLDALEKIRQEDYDILLTDVKMPFMDGIELIDNVVNEKKKMRCVIFSGCNEFDYAKRAIRLGVVDYIQRSLRIRWRRLWMSLRRLKPRMSSRARAWNSFMSMRYICL